MSSVGSVGTTEYGNVLGAASASVSRRFGRRDRCIASPIRVRV